MELEDKDQLKKDLEQCSYLLDGLEGYEPFKAFVKCFKEQADICDANWQNLNNTSDELFLKLRSLKISYLNIINFIDNTKARKQQLEEELNQSNSKDE